MDPMSTAYDDRLEREAPRNAPRKPVPCKLCAAGMDNRNHRCTVTSGGATLFDGCRACYVKWTARGEP